MVQGERDNSYSINFSILSICSFSQLLPRTTPSSRNSAVENLMFMVVLIYLRDESLVKESALGVFRARFVTTFSDIQVMEFSNCWIQFRNSAVEFSNCWIQICKFSNCWIPFWARQPGKSSRERSFFNGSSFHPPRTSNRRFHTNLPMLLCTKQNIHQNCNSVCHKEGNGI